MKIHEGPHDGANPHFDPDTGEICFGCKVKTISTEPGAARVTQQYGGPRREVKEPSWEKGIAGEHRPGGGFMPYLNESSGHIGLHAWQAERAKRMQVRERQLTASEPLR